MSCNLIDRYDKIGQLEERLYTISEASEYVGVPESRLRGWEDAFRRLLKPERTPAGQHRRYTRKDLAIACRILELLD